VPPAEGTGLLRIAHQRVLESWERAQKIINDHRDFYRIRELVENHRRRWRSEGRRNDLLIPDGRNLEQAEALIARYGDELPRETATFVTLSAGRARRNRTIKRAMQISLAVVAILATGAGGIAIHFGNSAVKSEKRAVANYTAARDTVDGLVTGIAERLRDVDGISVRTVEDALGTVSKLVDRLEQEGGGDPELKRTRGTMQYQFAATFQAADNNQRAFKEASAGLTLRDLLVKLPQSKPNWEWDLALSLDQVGDIQRMLGQLKDAGARYDQALAIRQRLRRDNTEIVQFIHGLSLSLVRVGDLKLTAYKDEGARYEDALEAARANYDEASNVSIEVFRREPDDVRWQRELSWTFNKVGDIRMRLKKFSDALDAYEKGLCTRRFVSSRDDGNTLWKRDVAFSLEKVSEARQAEKDLAGAEEPLFEALAIRRTLAERDQSNTRLARELAGTLHHAGNFKKNQKKLPLAIGFYLAAIDVANRSLQRVPDNRFVKRQLEDSEKARAAAAEQLRAADAGAPTDGVLRDHARDEESTHARRILGRQDNPLICWGDLMNGLGVPAAARKTARAL
jgi:tetratricopeptide (TPR) repeat protein